MGRIAGRFARVEPRLWAGRLMLALLSDLPRKNCWTIAEWSGEKSPHGMQHLLCRASWDADAVRDDVREYVVEHLHDEEAVLVVDETGDVKKGARTVGVQRQYTGTAGRIENSQVAAYLVYAGARGHAAVDRELYVPRSWTSDPDRCRAARLAEDTFFATKPELALTMIERFLDGGHHIDWVTGDEVYGDNPKLQAALEERGLGYVLAVAWSAQVPLVREGSAPTCWRASSQSGPGRSCPPAPARRGTLTTTGPTSTSRRATVSCCSGAAAPPANSPTTAAIPPGWLRCAPWSGRRDPGSW
ncbi:IS701 family transposase [Streptomyces sp. NPDC002206]